MTARDGFVWVAFLGITSPLYRAGAVEPERAKPANSGAYVTGQYRNLFAEQGRSQQQIDSKINASFQQLFHGDPKTQAIYYETGANANGPLAYITDVANHDARTEGMSYGMMIAVQMDKKHEFDAIWNWANTYMLVTDPANPSHGYFAWSMNIDGSPRSDSPAPDGEEYFVMALYFADHRWGSSKGIYNYKGQADRILALMRHHAQERGVGPFRLKPRDPPFASKQRPPELPRTSKAATNMPVWTQPGERIVGPMVSEQYNMILFVPNSGGNTFSDPSYHLPAFYELWARWGPAEDRAFWSKAADVSRRYFVKISDPVTGLGPDKANLDGSRMMDQNQQEVPFSYDSWRTASNWAVDYSWWHASPEEPVLSDRIQKFLYSQGIDKFNDRYTLDGKSLSDRHSIGMVATTAASGLAATPNLISRAFLDELWQTPVPAGEQRYYDGMLYMMSLLHCGGEFRIWSPRNPHTQRVRSPISKMPTN